MEDLIHSNGEFREYIYKSWPESPAPSPTKNQEPRTKLVLVAEAFRNIINKKNNLIF